MGKKVRRTRWRALPIADEVSDSEDSSTNPPTPGATRWHHQKPPGRFLSQPAPRRRCDGSGPDKSTRSSSTASENKITFNEDEYTKITTPRQDVLFKKGYLNKPRNYQTQTSTGTSTTSTGNSTGNGTPDHQSTDLEYESQFMFPNGFVDQNGIYYVNSYEPYPLMLYNPSTYYPEYTSVDKKRYSTGSLTESTSPNNEETTSQEHSQAGSEAPTSVSEFSHHQCYNMVYPGYYVNGVCPPSELSNGHCASDPVKRLKKRRRRKTSTTQEDTSEYTDEKSSDDEETTKSHPPSSLSPASCGSRPEEPADAAKPPEETAEAEPSEEDHPEEPQEAAPGESSKPKYDLKPDAQEFVPRAYRNHDLPPIPVKLVPPNFVPVPLLPVGDQAFIPPAIPVNFFSGPPGFVSFVPPPFEVAKREGEDADRKCPDTSEPSHTANNGDETKEMQAPQTNKNAIDIASVVSKLEEAVKEQEESQKADDVAMPRSPPQRNQRYRNNFRRNVYKTQTPQNSGEQTPVFAGHRAANGFQEEYERPTSGYRERPPSGSPVHQNRNSPQRFRKNNWKQNGYQTGSPRRYQTSPGHSPNYSDLLKKPDVRSQHPSYEKQNSCPPKLDSSTKDVKNVIPSAKPNQWIPVSSKKKRKGKNVEEAEDSAAFEAEEAEQFEEFESYDVNQLVDVIPPSKTDESVSKPEIEVELKQNSVEEILTTIITTTTPAHEVSVNFKIPEVSEIEKELITKVEEDKAEEVLEEKFEETAVASETIEDEDTKVKPKKKSKKATQKAVTKRVIITDVDLSMNFTKAAEPPEEKGEVEKKEETVVAEEEEIVKVEEVIKVEEEVVKLEEKEPKEETVAPETQEKKGKKKKKKASKPALVNASLNGPDATADETYDFLLDNTVLSEAADKTNDEISQEFDRIIQKGMYSSLEGKIKSLNVDATDGFFNSVIFGTAPPKLDKPTFGSGAAFGGAFQRQPLKPVSVEEPLVVKCDNAVAPDASADGEKSGFFLENVVDRAGTLYPVTAAVKQWMVKTRETTPDVEILKSPGEIYGEMCESGSETDTAVGEDEEEVVLFRKEPSVDLLECWENFDDPASGAKLCSTPNGCAKCNVSKVGGAPEVYESKYGQNEDYLNLRREVRNQADSATPTHGGLAYRGVCCSLQ